MKYVNLLGKKVHPIIKKNSYVDPDHTTGGQHHYLSGDERRKLVNNAAKQYWDERRKENREQEWTVWGVFVDDTFELLSDLGYSQKGVSRSDFRLIKQ